jgi:ATP-dependent Clp protease ATP-binding subunit ClpC
MTSVKVPVLVSKYAEDLFTARVVDGPEADASGVSASDSLASVRSFLRKQGAREPDQYWPKIESYELQDTMVRVRLFYRDGKRQFPASREMKVPVRYVIGRYVDDSVECFLPDYDIVFHCPAIRELPQLIDEAVRTATAQIVTRDLAAATPPEQSELRVVRVRLKEKRADFDMDVTETLSVVADPVFTKQRKRRSIPTKHRDSEAARLVEAMNEASVLMVGPSGCGKTTVANLAATVHQFDANHIAKLDGKAPPPPLVWQSSAENLIAGMQYLGEWEQRLERVIAELESISGVLLVSSLIDLVRLGGTQPSDSIAAFLMPYIRRGEIRLVAETTAEELDATRRLLPGWAECFQILPIDLLTHSQTRDIADTMLKEADRNYQIDVEENTAETATRLFAQFMPYQSPPRGVVQLLSDVIERTRRNQPQRKPSQGKPLRDRPTGETATITTAMIVEQFTKLTGLPEAMLRDSLTLHSDQVRDRFVEQVMGQPIAVDAVTNVVLRLKAGLCDPRRPVATMLFCGPTGVGKTQMARSLAEYLFGESESIEKPLIRLDMSEYGNWDAVDRFLISPDGEVASWIGQLRARPMSVVLLDEFEKSSPEVHDCLLSALDEGRLTDRFGRTATLCGAIVILTSNVGSRSTSSVGFGNNDVGAIRRAVEQEFRPEFLNRLDEVVTFEPLPPTVIEQIVEKELRALAKREILQARRVQLTWDDSIVKRLAAVGFDPLLGARPLQRAIEREVVAKIARCLLTRGNESGPIEIDLADLMSA